MNYILLIIFFLLLCLIVNVISPFIRNLLKFKDNQEIENNLSGKLVKFFYKKNREKCNSLYLYPVRNLKFFAQLC